MTGKLYAPAEVPNVRELPHVLRRFVTIGPAKTSIDPGAAAIYGTVYARVFDSHMIAVASRVGPGSSIDLEAKLEGAREYARREALAAVSQLLGSLDHDLNPHTNPKQNDDEQ